nr:hypothetical protein [Tanacetum cinerariifolium]
MAECPSTYVESGTRCNGCVFDGIPLLSFDEPGKANYEALREVYSYNFLSHELIKRQDMGMKNSFIEGLLFKIQQQNVRQDGGASEAIQELRDAIDDVRGQNHWSIMQLNAMRPDPQQLSESQILRDAPSSGRSSRRRRR